MIGTNFLKEKLRKDIPAIGTWNTLGSPAVTAVLAQGGLDFQILDLEHGPFDLARVHEHVGACGLTSCSLLVRSPVVEPWAVLQALDQGAHGVIVPHMEDAAAVRRFVSMVKYHPAGGRGYSPFTHAGGFTGDGNHDYAARANAFTLCGIVIESRKGIDNLDEILRVEGLDVVYFGSYDLSQAFGVPGEARHPRVLEAISEGARRVRAAGKSAGGFVSRSREDIDWLLGMGMRFFTHEVDAACLQRAYKDTTRYFHEKRESIAT